MLSIKLNNITDKGGDKFFRDIIGNSTLKELDMSGN